MEAKPKWTPGPWAVEDDPINEDNLIIVEANKQVYEWRVIAGLQAGEEPGDITASDLKANAALISAAPEMYEALQEVLREIDANAISRACFTDQFITDMRGALRKTESNG